MTEAFVLTLARDTLTMTLMLAAPIMGVGLIIGLGVSIFQALTQIHEMTLTFVPKLIGMALVIVILGPWMLQNLLQFTTRMLGGLAPMAR
ncbi:MAG TPA: flagellar biosynthesis protein FliQ [Chloroflexi bacterium]|nr:flagellar biosynthesis protein FliQ [Chloroflexota bacterium]